MNSSETPFSLAKVGKVILTLALNLILFTAILFGSGNLYQTFVKPMTAKASPYPMAQVKSTRTPLEDAEADKSEGSENLIENTREKLKETADTVREKLNLDEPISPSTKAFAEDLKEKVAHPLTGDKDLVNNESNWQY